MIEILAARGGVVGINFESAFLTEEANLVMEGMMDAHHQFVADRGLEDGGPRPTLTLINSRKRARYRQRTSRTWRITSITSSSWLVTSMLGSARISKGSMASCRTGRVTSANTPTCWPS